MAGDAIPPAAVLYLRRYVSTHYSTGKPKKTPTVAWQLVVNPRPGDYRYERGAMVPGPCKTPYSCASVGCAGECAF